MKYTITIAVFVLVAGLVQAKTLSGSRGKYFYLQSFGRLPHYWGQEAVFTPEARRWLARLAAKESYVFHRPTVGIWDAFHGEDGGDGGRISYEALQGASVGRVGQELQKELAANTSSTRLGTHGRDVTSLAVGKPPFGISVLGELNFLINANSNAGEKIDPQDLYGSISRPDVLNVSYGGGTALGLSDVLPGYTTIVLAAGNRSLQMMKTGLMLALAPGLERRELILVGASDPGGKISYYSNVAHIYAPGEHLFPNGSIALGTSLSAPMVSGALADMFAILPPTAITSLTAEVNSMGEEFFERREFNGLIIHLLQETSTPMVTTDDNIRSGGILNHYKLLRVAHRIAQQAGSGDQSVAQLIEDPRMYDFTAEALQLYEETVRLRNSAEVEPQEVLSKLREAVALDVDVHNQDARRALGAVYAQAGYTSLAEFYGLPVAMQQSRIQRTMDKASLLDGYAEVIDTPQLVRKYLNKDLLLAMMWADSTSTDEWKWDKQNLSADNPWQMFDSKNPLPFIIKYSKDVQRYSKDVQQAKQLVDAVLERFDLSEEKVTLTLPSFSTEIWEGDEYEVIGKRLVEIDTDFLIGHDAYPLVISDEARVARQLPVFRGQSLNLVEWSILRHSHKLFANHYETLHAIIKDADNLELANKIAEELKGHIYFAVSVNYTGKHREALEKLLDLHKQVSSASEHQALLDSITPN